MDSKKYSNIKLGISIGKSIVVFALVLLFVYSGYSKHLEDYIRTFTENDYFVFILFIIVTSFASGILFFPLSYYTEFYLEHKFNLSNQSFYRWIWENVKGILVSAVIGIPILLIFYYTIKRYDEFWWLIFAVVLFLFSVLLARIVPVFILPLFYKITPFENEELKEIILGHAKNAGLKVQAIYKFDMSKNTKKANAAFTGLGKSKRILLGDTLIEHYTNDEIETVIAHELGHYKKKHIIKNIFVGTITSFLTLYILSLLYKISLPWFGFTYIWEVGALPLLMLWSMLIALIQTPLSNMLSRNYEYEADKYSLESTGKKEAYISTLNKLTEQNLGDKDPHPFVEWFFYSHPSVKNRIKALEQYH
ncbi:MAG: M48 family metallopeptidase [Syntrophothermus sp.]